MTIFDDAATEGHRLIALSESQAREITGYSLALAAQEQVIADLEAELAQYRIPVLRDTDGVSLHAAIADIPEGGKLKVVGTFETQTVANLKSGVILDLTEAVIRPAVGADRGFDLKTPKAADVTFIGGDIGGFSMRGIVPYSGFTMEGGVVHHCLQMGVGCDGEGLDWDVITLRGTEFHHCGSDQWTTGTGAAAAGVKFFHVRRLRLEDIYTHDNIGNGAWTDWQSGEVFLSGRAINNSKKGFFFEKCGAADGTGGPEYAGRSYEGGLTVDGFEAHGNPQGGVVIISSRHAVVTNSTFGGNNGQAVVVRNDPARLTMERHGFPISDITLGPGNTLNDDRYVIGADARAAVVVV